MRYKEKKEKHGKKINEGREGEKERWSERKRETQTKMKLHNILIV